MAKVMANERRVFTRVCDARICHILRWSTGLRTEEASMQGNAERNLNQFSLNG